MTTNASLLDRRRAAVAGGVSTSTPIFVARAQNAEIWDVEGRRYIDFGGGIGVQNVGHCHPRVVAAVREQASMFMHTAFQVSAYESYIALAERLNALAPFRAPAKSVCFTTGAEAVENAVKIARAATGRPGVIAFSGAFHGRTTLTMALTGKVAPYKRQFGVSPPGVFHAPFPAYGVSAEQSLCAIEDLFRVDIDPEMVSAFIIEPVQGEGGFHAAPPELLRGLRAICNRHGILLIADEVQSGVGRTGRMFAIEHSGVEPDILTVAKSLGGGAPISAIVARADILDRVEPGGLGGTYGGSPLACAAALAVLDVMQDEGLLARAEELGQRLRRRVEAMRTPALGKVRGLGAMLAFDVKNAGGGPDAVALKQVLARALERGLLLLSCGVSGESIRFLAPLTTPFGILDEGLDVLEQSLS